MDAVLTRCRKQHILSSAVILGYFLTFSAKLSFCFWTIPQFCSLVDELTHRGVTTLSLNSVAPCGSSVSLCQTPVSVTQAEMDEKRLPVSLCGNVGWNLPLVSESISSVQQHGGQDETPRQARPPAAVKSFVQVELSCPHAALCLLLLSSSLPLSLLCISFLPSFLLSPSFPHQSQPLTSHNYTVAPTYESK